MSHLEPHRSEAENLKVVRELRDLRRDLTNLASPGQPGPCRYCGETIPAARLQRWPSSVTCSKTCAGERKIEHGYRPQT